LPVFRFQRLRALNQPYYVSDARDMLLDHYAAIAEYSAGVLEDVYLALEIVGNHLLSEQMSDEVAAKTLNDIANEEDLNGRPHSPSFRQDQLLDGCFRGFHQYQPEQGHQAVDNGQRYLPAAQRIGRHRWHVRIYNDD
jgi:hypothetical protein